MINATLLISKNTAITNIHIVFARSSIDSSHIYRGADYLSYRVPYHRELNTLTNIDTVVAMQPKNINDLLKFSSSRPSDSRGDSIDFRVSR